MGVEIIKQCVSIEAKKGSISEIRMSAFIMLFSLMLLSVLLATVLPALIPGFDHTEKVYDALAVVLIYSPAVMFLYKKNPIDFTKELNSPLIAKYTIIGLLIIFPTLLSLYYFELPILSVESQNIPQQYSDNITRTIIHLILACIIIPICEEIIFRYYFYNILKDRYGLHLGVIISTALFVGAHYFNPINLVLVFQGLLYLYVYQKSNSIFSSIILHIFNNSMWIFLVYISAFHHG